jgi:hypothetical protein
MRVVVMLLLRYFCLLSVRPVFRLRAAGAIENSFPFPRRVGAVELHIEKGVEHSFQDTRWETPFVCRKRFR